MSGKVTPKLVGRIMAVERTEDTFLDESGDEWRKCILTVELTGFSGRGGRKEIPEGLLGKKVKVVRWCLYDWHYKVGVRKTLDRDETEALIKGIPHKNVYW